MYPEDVLASASLFSELSRRDLKRLAAATITRAYKKGEVIVKEGENAVAFYLVTKGRVNVVRDNGREEPDGAGDAGPGRVLRRDGPSRFLSALGERGGGRGHGVPCALAVGFHGGAAVEPEHRRADAAGAQPEAPQAAAGHPLEDSASGKEDAGGLKSSLHSLLLPSVFRASCTLDAVLCRNTLSVTIGSRISISGRRAHDQENASSGSAGQSGRPDAVDPVAARLPKTSAASRRRRKNRASSSTPTGMTPSPPTSTPLCGPAAR